MVEPIPEGYQTVTPYFIVEGADGLINFLNRAFGAEQRGPRMTTADGSIGHAEVVIGDSVVMVADATEQFPPKSGLLHLYVPDCDATYQRALEAGATSTQEPTDQFYGDRSGGVTDAWGNTWWISTHVEDVPADEMGKRVEEWAAQRQ
jgi:PhnB protein